MGRQFKILIRQCIWAITTLLIVSSYNGCGSFEEGISLDTVVDQNSQNADINLKLENRSGDFIITSDFDSSASAGKTFVWWYSTDLAAGQDTNRYAYILDVASPELSTKKLPANFSGLVMLSVNLNNGSQGIKIFSAPLRVILVGNNPSGPTPTPAPVTPKPTAVPTAAPTVTPKPTPTPIPAPTGTLNTEADWQIRSNQGGVFYKQNFKDFADTTAMRNAKVIGYSTANDSSGRLAYETKLATGTVCLSGSKCLEIDTYDAADSQGGGWGQNYKNGQPVNGFYFQFNVRMTRNELTWVYLDDAGKTLNGAKVINLEQYGSGQVTILSGSNHGFLSAFINGAPGVKRYISSSITGYGSDWFYQPAINNLNMSTIPGAGMTKYQAYARKYGPSRYLHNTLRDYGYKSGNANLNHVDQRGFPWPEPEALASGAVPWAMDNWTTVELFIYNDFTGSAGDKLKIWAAPRGGVPVKTHDFQLTGDGSIEPTGLLGNGTNYYTQFELLHQSTHRVSEVGYRPTMKRHYDELIGSNNWIPFPGQTNVGEPK